MRRAPGLDGLAAAPRWAVVACCALVLALASALGIVRATGSSLDKVARLQEVTPALSGASDGVENILLVGSDSRVGSDPSDADWASVGSESGTPGMRSDSMIIVRRDTRSGKLALMSIPRDLLVRVGETDELRKINAVYQRGPEVLVRTVQRSLNIPIHHYVEIGFPGFRRIVDAIGGVTICLEHPSRDKPTGFFSRRGCRLLTGAKALAYARSRHFEEKKNGRWVMDGTGDVGRGERQRGFMSALVKDTVRHLASRPLDTDEVLAAFAAAVRVDGRLSLLDLGRRLRPLAEGGAESYSLPVNSDMVDGVFVFRLANDAQALLGYFAGIGPAPAR